ncbi:MAG: hypothetical protein VYA34_13245 [Myxococcota bacterium]|nr:hypothetical protein [Myxococcota bacterium]
MPGFDFDNILKFRFRVVSKFTICHGFRGSGRDWIGWWPVTEGGRREHLHDLLDGFIDFIVAYDFLGTDNAKAFGRQVLRSSIQAHSDFELRHSSSME